jgi:D-beta-D-heptose 7-phosphate kinase/D-beta-D-heptose 1-phosphate adenosyltransferase
MRKKHILIIGESCRDVFNYGTCARLCPEQPVPIFKSKKTIENAGMALNVYNNIVTLGIDADIITNKNWSTITKTRFIDSSSNHMFMRLDVNDDEYIKYDTKTIDYDKYDAIIVSDYNKGFISEQQIEQISLNHSCVFLDTKKYLGSWCENVTFIKINEQEYLRNKHFILDRVIDKTIITLGSKGASLNEVIYPVPKVEIRDVAGAGDSFIAGLVVKYIEHNNIIESIEFANDCATKVVQKRGVSVI